jgi:small GTP-binding protein
MSTKIVLKVSLCGPNAVGKSSIGSRLSKRVPNQKYVYTIGVDFFARRLPSYNTKINIWDLSGSTRFQDIILPYVRTSNVLLYVYDITRYRTIIDLRKLHELYKKEFIIHKVHIIVIGNKRDNETHYNSCMSLGEKFAKEIGDVTSVLFHNILKE